LSFDTKRLVEKVSSNHCDFIVS